VRSAWTCSSGGAALKEVADVSGEQVASIGSQDMNDDVAKLASG
jgi:hypothetical protein